MSNPVLDQCWPLQIPPTQKAVLISLADNANDAGECWPSQPKIAERTCLSERAVRDAIKALEASGHLVADRSNGRHTRYIVTPTPAPAAAPAGAAAPAYAAGEPRQELPEPRHMAPEPRQELPPNRKEPSLTVRKATQRSAPTPALGCPDGVDPQTWVDWLALRKAKRAPVTETVLRQARAEAEKAGMPLGRFLEIWCARGSQGLEAHWLKPNERAGPAQSTRPSASADFRGKTYAGTAIDDLPPDLRDAARAALADEGG